jgi:hypothetical protein
MLQTLKRIRNDIFRRKNLDAYAASLLAFVTAIFTVIQDNVSLNLQMAALLAAVAVLVFRTTDPNDNQVLDLDDVLKDRQSYGKLRDFIRNGKTVWIYGASAVNVLRNIEDIKAEVLDKGGEVRVLMQDPREQGSVNILYKQLDGMHDLSRDIENSQDIIRRVKTRLSRGQIDYRFVPYSPGFSLLIVDADGREGRLVVEYYGYENELITERMHIEIHRSQSAHWFEYWEKQYRLMWDSARPPEAEPHAPA